MAKTILFNGEKFKLSVAHYFVNHLPTSEVIGHTRAGKPIYRLQSSIDAYDAFRQKMVKELDAEMIQLFDARKGKAMTVARVLKKVATDEKDNPVFVVLGTGYAICHEKDVFRKKMGKGIAIERALFDAFGSKRVRKGLSIYDSEKDLKEEKDEVA
jgi:hypothetical protein